MKFAVFCSCVIVLIAILSVCGQRTRLLEDAPLTVDEVYELEHWMRALPDSARSPLLNRTSGETVLQKYEARAFPILARHLQDTTPIPSIPSTLSTRSLATVGDYVYEYVETLIFPVNYIDDYYGCKVESRRVIVRETIPDSGKMMTQRYPYKFYTRATLADWLRKRHNASLQSLRIDFIESLIEEEELVGFSNRHQRRKILRPLEKKLRFIRRGHER